MNVAYVFSTPNASFILEKMIVPQLEEGRHGANVVGMFFFVDNNYLLVRGNPTGERLAAVSRKTGMLLMGCDQCCYQRAIADKLIEGIPIGCFPDLYKALSGREGRSGDHAVSAERTPDRARPDLDPDRDLRSKVPSRRQGPRGPPRVKGHGCSSPPSSTSRAPSPAPPPGSRRSRCSRSALRALAPEERLAGASWLAGDLRAGADRARPRGGAGRARRRPNRPAEAALSVAEVDAALDRIAAARGGGSGGERARLLAALLARGTAEERDFLARLIAGRAPSGRARGGARGGGRARRGAPRERGAPRRRWWAVRSRRSRRPRSPRARRGSPASGCGSSSRCSRCSRSPRRTWTRRSPRSARPRSSGSSTAPGCRCTRTATEVRVFSRALRDVTPAVPEVVEAVRRDAGVLASSSTARPSRSARTARPSRSR